MNPPNYPNVEEEAPPPLAQPLPQELPVVGVPLPSQPLQAPVPLPPQPPQATLPLPPQPPQATLQAGPWSTGLCGCFEDSSSCCLTFWCPCIAFGRISEILDQGKTSCCNNGAIYTVLLVFTGCACLFSCLYRTKMRKTFMLQQSPCNDCGVHWFCDSCALCQEYRELQNRGFDPRIGWEGNTRKQMNQGVTIAPSAPPAPAPVFERGMER